MLAALAVIALALAWAATAGGAARAGPLWQESPIAPAQEQLSPLPTAVPAAEPAPAQPAPAASPVPEPPPAPPAAEQPIPMAALVGVMGLIGLAALIIGLRRR